MLKPVLDFDVLKRRHDTVDYLVQPRCMEYVKYLQKHLRKIKDLRRLTPCMDLSMS